ncbi:PREDICTED: elongation of very long chain fatty acids protein AAEL008004-like [Rhagoletis zephyria]|uniref:elongation of very long chain fatty acids protein AAEL008004-like n=1 Tax=Rhagoletis zephyria TaxID=28612 RepID=UPI0008119B12|nr:PREDICTED: elongation of very long chain fatty acids protein AAEL008004-like [Rhagoletis zephyria]
MSNLIASVYNFLTAPGTLYGNRFLPFHGALLPYLLADILYVLLVFKIGPWYMKNRPPYKLQTVMRYYNIGQIIYNAYCSYVGFYLYVYKRPTPITCITILPTNHPLKDIEGIIGALYVVNKFTDYFDTIVFVLRKSYKQITFLHVYHHIMMTTLSLLFIRYTGGGGHASMVGILNTCVHVFMYTYYLMSATRPEMKKSLWWKKYVTRLQLVQFVLILVHQVWPLVIQRDCEYPKLLCLCTSLQAILMLYLFGSFYIKTYIRRPEEKVR